MPISLDHSIEEYTVAKSDPVEIAYELLSLGYKPKVVMNIIPLLALESGLERNRPEDKDWSKRFSGLSEDQVHREYNNNMYRYLGEPSIGLGQFNPSKHMARMYQFIKHSDISEPDLTVDLPNGEKFFINDEMANKHYYNYVPYKSPEYHTTTPAMIASLRRGVAKMPMRDQLLLFDQLVRDQIDMENGDMDTALRNLYYHSMNKIDNWKSYNTGDDVYKGFDNKTSRKGYERSGQFLHAQEAFGLIDNDPFGVVQKALQKIKIEGPSNIKRSDNTLINDRYTKYTDLEHGQNNADFFKYLTYWSEL